MFGVRDDISARNGPTPKVPSSVVVEVLVVRSELVLYAKPRMVADEPPVSDIYPFRVMEFAVTKVEVDVVRIEVAANVEVDMIVPVDVPAGFTEYARK